MNMQQFVAQNIRVFVFWTPILIAAYLLGGRTALAITLIVFAFINAT